MNEEDSYWYCDYIGLESGKKQNRHILGFRHWSQKKTKIQTIFLARRIPIPTRFIHRNDREKLKNVMQIRENDAELSRLEMACLLSHHDRDKISVLEKRHPLLDFALIDGDYTVFQIRAPPNKSTLDKLPGIHAKMRSKELKGPFQKGGYEWQVRTELYPKWLSRKVSFDERLEKILLNAEDVSALQEGIAGRIEEFARRMHPGENEAEEGMRRQAITRTANQIYNYIENKTTKGLSSFLIDYAKSTIERRGIHLLQNKEDLEYYAQELARGFVPDADGAGEKKQKKLLADLVEYFQTKNARGSLKKFLEALGEKELKPAAEYIRKDVGQTAERLKEIDDKNEIKFNPDTQEYEITLACHDTKEDGRIARDQIPGINWRTRKPTAEEIEWGAGPDMMIPDKLTHEELGRQVMCYLDIEKVFFKRDAEQALLDERKGWLQALEKEQTPQRREAIEATVREIEKQLTITIDEKEVRLWEEEYEDRVTDYTCVYRMQDGTEIRENDTIRNFRNSKTQQDLIESRPDNFTLTFHQKRKELMDAVAQRMKARNASFIIAHNLGYDLPESIRESKDVKSEKWSLFVSNIVPRVDVAIGPKGSRKKSHVRMKRLVEFLDTYRLAAGFWPFLKGAMPLGTHKLEDVARYSGCDFGKTHDSQGLREDGIRDLWGNDEACMRLTRYALKDVPPLPEIMNHGDFMRLLTKLQFQLFPFCSLTEIGFSPNIAKKLYDYTHWQRNGNKRHEQRGQKQKQEQAKKFERMEPGIKRDWISRAGIDHSSMPEGGYTDVWQAYMPAELWLKDAMLFKYPEWRGFFAALQNEKPIQKFGLLRYARSFFKQYLLDYYNYTRESSNYQANKEALGLPQSDIEELLIDYWEQQIPDLKKYGAAEPQKVPRIIAGKKDEYDSTFEILLSLYTTCYLSFGRQIQLPARKRSRRPKKQAAPLKQTAGQELEQGFEQFLGKGSAQPPEQKTMFDEPIQKVMQPLVGYFERNNPRMVNLRALDPDKSGLKEAQKKLLAKYQQCYDKLMEITESRTKGILDQKSDWDETEQFGSLTPPAHFGIEPKNIVYVAQQFRRLCSLEKAFFAKYGLPPEQEDPFNIPHEQSSLAERISKAFSRLKEELKDNRIIQLRGDYLFLEKPPKENGMLIPLRKIDLFVHRKNYSEAPESDSVQEEFEFDLGEAE